MTVAAHDVFLCIPVSAQQLTAKEIVTKADEKFNGEMSGYSVMSMTIVRPTWQRTVEFKSWSLEDDYALTLITAPAGKKGRPSSSAATRCGAGTRQSTG